MSVDLPSWTAKSVITSGLGVGAFGTVLCAWFLRNRLLNFEFCPEGTTDYCAWNLPFFVATFGPVFLASSLIAIGAILGVRRFRGTQQRS